MPLSRWQGWWGVLAAIALVAAATIVALTVLGEDRPADAAMLYLLAIVVMSMKYGRGPSLFAATASVLSFNFFFVEPHFTFRVSDVRQFVTFGVMFLVPLVISGLDRRLRVLAEEAQRARQRIETEQLNNALLSSISHDLKTPLAVVTGAASTLLEEGVDPAVRRELTETILQEADRLNRLLQNLLDMTRLEAGALRVRPQWHSLEEVIGSAIARVEKMLGPREIVTELPRASMLVPLDALLVEQVLVNLLENAAKYAPPGSPILVAARQLDDHVDFEVSDRGPGISVEEASLVFDKFHRGRSDRGGAGLGLTICRGIVTAHGGRIWVEPRSGGGARFRFRLPIVGKPPVVADESSEALKGRTA